MFEKASRLKLRFETKVGCVNVEDLWDIPLTGSRLNLDSIAKDLYKSLKDNDVKSFVEKDENSKDELSQLKFDIVKHIIDVRLSELEIIKKQKLIKEKKQKILSIISEKEDQNLRESSIDDLRKMLDEI